MSQHVRAHLFARRSAKATYAEKMVQQAVVQTAADMGLDLTPDQQRCLALASIACMEALLNQAGNPMDASRMRPPRGL